MAFRSGSKYVSAIVLACAVTASAAAEVPLAGFTPYVGLSLTDRYKSFEDADPNFILADVEEFGAVGNWLSKTGSPHFEVAIYDSGASVTVLSPAARENFNIVGAGFDGENPQPLFGAAGRVDGVIEDPLSTFVAGLGDRTGDGPLQLDPSILKGLSNVAIATGPEELGLPNLVGLPLISKFATHIQSDQPLIFRHNDTTIRTPHLELEPLGSTERGNMLRADLQLLRSGTFVEPLAYVPDLTIDPDDILNGTLDFTDNPTTPTVVGLSALAQAAMFIDADISNAGHEERDVSMMLDTGASVSVVSVRMADRLGFDAGVDEPAFYATVIGAGGAIEAPGFIADELSIVVEGGEFTLHDVPLLAFNLPNLAEVGSTLDGLLGMNVFMGRNLVLDPDPILSGGSAGPSLYISEPVTHAVTWAATQPVANWQDAGSWSSGQLPDGLATVEIGAAAGAPRREVVLQSEAQVYTVDVRGAPGAPARLSLESNSTLWVFGGTTLHEGATISVGDDATLDAQFIDLDGGTFVGSGLVRAEIENRFGVVSPGDPVGLLTVEGIFANRQGGMLQIDIGGTIAGDEYDVLEIDGLTVLGGTLEVRLAELGNGIFSPSVGDAFEILTSTEEISGEFAEFSLPAGFEWNVLYNPTSVVLSVLDVLALLGDYNGNGQVEQGDLDLVLLNWGAGAATPPTGWTSDLPSGSIDQDELDRVLLNWGNAAAGSALVSAGGGVPEPASVVLILAAAACCGVCLSIRRAFTEKRPKTQPDRLAPLT
jgi:hypothetical protein